MRISDWSSDVCSSDLPAAAGDDPRRSAAAHHGARILDARIGDPRARVHLSHAAGGVPAQSRQLRRPDDHPRGSDARRDPASGARMSRPGKLAVLAVVVVVLFGASLMAGKIWVPFSAWWSADPLWRSEEHTSELQSLMRISYA